MMASWRRWQLPPDVWSARPNASRPWNGAFEAELEALVRDLNARLGAVVHDSGTPPSAIRQAHPSPSPRRAPGKKPGGQPGHPPRLKRRLPPERLP